MGVREEVQLIWPRHRRWVKSHGCCVPVCDTPVYRVEFCHWRHREIKPAANSGTGRKPHDGYGLSLCAEHHRQQHDIGQRAFEERYRINMADLAKRFRDQSPDREMRESFKSSEESR